MAISKTLSKSRSIKISLSEPLKSGTAALPKPSMAKLTHGTNLFRSSAVRFAQSVVIPTYLITLGSVGALGEPASGFTYCSSNPLARLTMSVGGVEPVLIDEPDKFTVKLPDAAAGTTPVVVAWMDALGFGAA